MAARRTHAIRCLSALQIVSGIALLAYLNVSDWVARYEAERHITAYTSVVNVTGDARRAACKEQALLYNEALAGSTGTGELPPYEEQLAYGGDAMMGYLQIPRIHVKLPIYHGTGEEQLMAGIGHLESSSLPIGGSTAHCVLMGHSGMENARMLDDLPLLAAGDEFVVWTLNEPYAYRVFETETVLPEEVPGRIELQAGRDLVTLVTCTPYGVNDHRLLVHAARCAYVTSQAESGGFETYANQRNVPLAAAVATLCAGGLIAGLKALCARRKRSRGRHCKQRRQSR